MQGLSVFMTPSVPVDRGTDGLLDPQVEDRVRATVTVERAARDHTESTGEVEGVRTSVLLVHVDPGHAVVGDRLGEQRRPYAVAPRLVPHEEHLENALGDAGE